MKQKCKSRNECLNLWSTDFWQGCQGNSAGKEVFSTTGAGTIGYPHAKEGS